MTGSSLEASLYRSGSIRLNACAASALGQQPVDESFFAQPPGDRALLSVALDWDRAARQLTLRGGEEGPFSLKLRVYHRRHAPLYLINAGTFIRRSRGLWVPGTRRFPLHEAAERTLVLNRGGGGRIAAGAVRAEQTPLVAWLNLGLQARTAKALLKAGYRTVEDFADMSREEVFALPGVGIETLAIVDRHAGTSFVSRKSELEEKGLSIPVVQALRRVGIRSLEALSRLTREQFLDIEGLGRPALRSCEQVLGRKLDSPVEGFRRLGLWPPSAYKLAAAGIRTLQELPARPDLSDFLAERLRPEDIEICRQVIRQGKTTK